MQIIEGAGAYTVPGEGPSHWAEHFRVPDLSVGTYSIPAGGVDDQTPHLEDEVYVVVRGRAQLETATGTAGVGPGTVVYVPAGERHTFTQVTEDLALLVIFAPAEGPREGADLRVPGNRRAGPAFWRASGTTQSGGPRQSRELARGGRQPWKGC
jgi:mannose-6-phosphate isomerase-like protein (cupin superfamily)